VTRPPLVVVHRDPDVLAAAVSARLVTRLVDAQAARGHAHLVLTGGGIGIATLAALAASPARDAVDWSRLDVWWGDERFLPDGHAERNATRARAALLDAVPLDPKRRHVMPASTGMTGDDADAAARAYADELAAACTPEDHDGVPTFDVLLLGVGPDGHVASLFPDHPGLYERERTVIGVHGSPKPPPTRISLTFRGINAAREIWLLASGAEKAHAVGLALTQTGELAVPAAGVHGRSATLWLLDRAAAGCVPPPLTRPASPDALSGGRRT
jgi:6-phosphogluconolactonase